ncbi:MAG TPA: hypothetical protein VHB99_06190 [Pirellulales bacterium]|nr:hypothetical protein [Pirellulales bacterium]
MPALLFSVATPHAGFVWADWGALVLYAAATAAIAWACSRKQGSTEEFFLAGRQMPWFAVGLSIMATLMSTISYLAVPGEMIRHGIGMFAGQMAIPFAMTVVLCLWVPFFMRLRLTSVYEYLEQRFGSGARLLAATLFILLRLGWLGVIVYTCSMAVDKMVEIRPLALPGAAWAGGPVRLPPLYLWIVLIGVFTTAYTAVGGIRAVIWTDVMQSVIMFAGVLITLSYVWIATGEGPADWWTIASEAHQKHTNPPWFAVDVTVRVTIFTAMLHSFFWIVCTHGSDQMVVQRYFTTTSLKAALRSYLISACSDLTIGALLAMTGLALLAFYLKHPTFLAADIASVETADKWFPYFIAHQLPPGLGGLILAALFAAGMSSVSSGINSVSAVAMTDVVPRLTGRSASGGVEAGEGASLARARWLSLAIGLLVTVLAVGFARLVETPATAQLQREEEIALEQSGKLAEEPDKPAAAAHAQNIMELMAKGFNMFLGPLAALFFIGMFLPRSTSRSAVPAVLCGLAVSIVWSYWHELQLPELLAGFVPAGGWFEAIGLSKLVGEQAGVPTFTLAIALPCATTVLSAFLLSWLVDSGREHAGRQWTWYAVMRRPIPPS